MLVVNLISTNREFSVNLIEHEDLYKLNHSCSMRYIHSSHTLTSGHSVGSAKSHFRCATQCSSEASSFCSSCCVLCSMPSLVSARTAFQRTTIIPHRFGLTDRSLRENHGVSSSQHRRPSSDEQSGVQALPNDERNSACQNVCTKTKPSDCYSMASIKITKIRIAKWRNRSGSWTWKCNQ